MNEDEVEDEYEYEYGPPDCSVSWRLLSMRLLSMLLGHCRHTNCGATPHDDYREWWWCAGRATTWPGLGLHSGNMYSLNINEQCGLDSLQTQISRNKIN